MLADNPMADVRNRHRSRRSTDAAAVPILVVDDNHDSALSLAMMLSIMGHETRTAHDGESAVVTAESFLPDVVLLDIGLPKLNGYEVAQRIRETALGRVDVPHRRHRLGPGRGPAAIVAKSGLNVHMVKPVEPSALEKLLAGLAARTVASGKF